MSLSVNLTGARTLAKQIEIIRDIFPEEVYAEILTVALVDIETFAKDKADIPVDTGRLRASIHTKYRLKPKPQTKTTTARLSKAEKESKNENGSSQMTFNYQAKVVDQVINKVPIYRTETFDGTLSVIPDELEVIVGTNVEYAQKINRIGGGGSKSRSGLPKGTGQGFWDKAVANGKMELGKRMRNLVNRMSKIEEVALKLAKLKSGGGDK